MKSEEAFPQTFVRRCSRNIIYIHDIQIENVGIYNICREERYKVPEFCRRGMLEMKMVAGVVLVLLNLDGEEEEKDLVIADRVKIFEVKYLSRPRFGIVIFNATTKSVHLKMR